jgi:SAM-dependent methyltransferase
VRCAHCDSIQLVDEPQDFAATEETMNTYIEAAAGIGSLAMVFADVDHSVSNRVLDIGCSYPFALDFARHTYGWDVVGVEPSPAGQRGARELGIDVRQEYLTADTAVGDDFLTIIASEVIEHVPQPVEFLQAVRARLAEHGTLVMTTPAAEIISPDEPITEVLLALSPGYHVFLASVKGMELLLTRAGFSSFVIRRDGGTLRINAYLTPPGDDRPATHSPPSLDELDAYYDWRGRRSPVNSELAFGLSARLFRLRVARGDFLQASKVRSRLIRSARAVHGIDLRNPASQRSLERLRKEGPWGVAGAAFALGMYELLYRNRPQRAAAYFTVCEVTVGSALAASGIVDGDLTDLRFQAPFHRALALARFDAAEAVALAMALPDFLDVEDPRTAQIIGSRQCRIFTELVSRGTNDSHSDLGRAVAEIAPTLARDSDTEVSTAGLDAMYSLGMSALATGDPDGASGRFALTIEIAALRDPSAHIEGLLATSRHHRDLAIERINAVQLPETPLTGSTPN